jgi:hypothetical protein
MQVTAGKCVKAFKHKEKRSGKSSRSGRQAGAVDFEEGEEEVQLDVPELGDVVVQEDGGGVLNGQ